VTAPAVVILPILFAVASVNHRLPSGPAVIDSGTLPLVGTGYSVNVSWAGQMTAAANTSPMPHKWTFILRISLLLF